mgnify:CR=1 FL=1
MKHMLAGVLVTVCTGAAFASADVPPALSTGAVQATVEELRRRLAQDGYPTDFLDDPRFMIHPETPRLIRAEQKADFFAPAYGIFTPKAFARAREFMAAHREALDRAHRQYGVWPEYIAALLLVESNYGRNTGTRRVINGLASMYASGRSWAYREITAFIGLRGVVYDDIFALRGSHAGAFGMAQMIPTSYRAFGVDFDGDGRVDPDSAVDAIGSVANYLKKCGFGATRESRLRAVLAYNKQRSYAEAIAAFAHRLRTGRDAGPGR